MEECKWLIGEYIKRGVHAGSTSNKGYTRGIHQARGTHGEYIKQGVHAGSRLVVVIYSENALIRH